MSTKLQNQQEVDQRITAIRQDRERFAHAAAMNHQKYLESQQEVERLTGQIIVVRILCRSMSHRYPRLANLILKAIDA